MRHRLHRINCGWRGRTLTWGCSKRGFSGLESVSGIPVTQGIKVGLKKLPVGENHMILGSLVLTHYQRVTDRQTDMTPIAKSRSSIAERDKISQNVLEHAILK